MSDYHEWLKTLTVGSKVIMQRGSYGHEIATVERMTPTQFVVGSIRFNTDTGRERTTGVWTKAQLVQPTPERVAEIRASHDATYLCRVTWTSLPPDILSAVRLMVEQAITGRAGK